MTISQLGHATRPTGTFSGQPRLMRSIFESATRAICFWGSRAEATPRRNLPTAEPVTDETTEEILEKLGGENLSFKNVASRYGNIDHVALSKEHGFFLIETKAHSGRVSVVDCRLRVNGKLPERDFVAQALRNTYWLIEEIRNVTGLDAEITPLLVFTNASVDTSRPLKGIPITNRASLRATIEREGQPISEPLWNAREKISAILTGATN
jgi:hypothetical protein